MRAFRPAVALALLLPLLGLTLYQRAAAPEAAAADEQAQPPAAAPAAAAVQLRRLRAHLERQPRDARGWVMRARLHFGMDRYTEAAQAYAKALALSSRVAADAAIWCEYADALGMAQGGSLSGKPREFIGRALALAPNHPQALEMAGSSAYERADYAAALRYWRALLAVQNPASRAYAELAAAISRTERIAAVTLPTERR